jgi:CelD/BcsL family acetyltransferase involved in cellulose biosynthesis
VISLLRGPERSIAAQLCIDDGRRFFELKIGYDEEWGKYSPGVLLAADTINFAVNVRASGYEFLGLAEDWQKAWATGTRGYCAAVFYPRTIAGATVRALDVVVSRAQRIRAAVSAR